MALNLKDSPCSSKSCYQCGKPSKYCCPKCSTRSCSLPCIQLHKKLLDCDGERDKSAFVKVKEFTDIDLLNDYRLLEETGRLLDNVCRTKRQKHAYHQPYLPYWLDRLKKECLSRSIKLILSPSTFTKRKENSTRYLFSDKIISWKIEWHFPQSNVVKTDNRVPENISLGDIVEKCFNDNANSSSNSLDFYKSTGLGGVKILLQSHLPEKHKDFGYYELDPTENLRIALKDRTIMEYPVIFVVLKDHIYSYPLLDPEANEERNKKQFLSDMKPILIDKRDLKDVESKKISKYFDF